MRTCCEGAAALGAIPPIELHDQQTRAGRYRPVIDRTHPLDDVVEAIRCRSAAEDR
jgi:hypothetical protein